LETLQWNYKNLYSLEKYLLNSLPDSKILSENIKNIIQVYSLLDMIKPTENLMIDMKITDSVIDQFKKFKFNLKVKFDDFNGDITTVEIIK
jgi:hypothetical protein